MSAFKKESDKEVITMSVSSVMSWLKLGTINLNPEYQRDSVWKKEQKVYLIDTILKGYDIPKLYILKLKDDTYDVVDGQQRIRTLNEFIEDEFSLSASGYEGEYSGRKFSQLPPKVRGSIDEFELHIVELTGDRWTDEVIRDIFLRLQKGTPLNPAEKRRALTGGVATVVSELASHAFFSECSQISDSRFGYEDAAAKILHLVFEGEKHGLKAAAIAKTYKVNKDLSSGDKRVQAIKRAMNYLSKAMSGNPYFKKYSALSVTTAMVELMDKYSFKNREDDVAALLTSIEERRLKNDKLSTQDRNYDEELAKLTAAARSDRTDHLKWRKKFYLNKLLSLDLKPVDPDRRFEKQVLSVLLNRQGFKCAICNCEITAQTSEVDHIRAHSRGGETDMDNAQLLCIKCNRSKGAK